MNKVKRTLIVCFAACFGLSTGLLAACEPKKPAACTVHQYESVAKVAAECEKDGSETLRCTVCGEEKVNVLPKLGHKWEETALTEATCTTAGSREQTCSRCLKKDVTVLPELGHKWKSVSVTKAPTCTEPGEQSAECERCHIKNEAQPIPALGHKWDDELSVVIQNPTCTEDGYTDETCSVCGEHGSEKIEKLNHQYVATGVVIKSASCTEAGIAEGECSRCGDKTEIEIPKLDHNFDTEFTIDVPPTQTTEGSRSRHCLNDGCSETYQEEKIPSLGSGENISYEFRLVRNNGDKLRVSGVTLSIKFGGEEITRNTTTNGSLSVSLPVNAYTVEVLGGLPLGYTVNSASYSFSAGEIVCRIPVTGSLIDGSDPTPARYSVGSAVENFTYTTLPVGGNAPKTITLKELLEEKKIVVLNFWATWCGPCESEFPALQSAYNSYQDDVAVVAINTAASGDEDQDIIDYAEGHGLSFYFVKDTCDLYSKFTTGSIPMTIIIDREGVVNYAHSSALNEATFRAMFELYTSEPYAAAALPVWKEN